MTTASESEREMLERHLREIYTMYAQFAGSPSSIERERERIEFRLRQLDAEEATKTLVENETHDDGLAARLAKILECDIDDVEQSVRSLCYANSMLEIESRKTLNVEDDGREIRCHTHNVCGTIYVAPDTYLTPTDARIFALRILKAADKAEEVSRG